MLVAWIPVIFCGAKNLCFSRLCATFRKIQVFELFVDLKNLRKSKLDHFPYSKVKNVKKYPKTTKTTLKREYTQQITDLYMWLIIKGTTIPFHLHKGSENPKHKLLVKHLGAIFQGALWVRS